TSAAEVVIDTMTGAYPILTERRQAILPALEREEVQFARTLDAGTAQLRTALEALAPAAEPVIGRSPDDLSGDAPKLPGDVAFRLHDTFGFPIDLTIELAAEYGVAVDRGGFDSALAEQRERSRSGKKAELARHAELAALYQGIQARGGDTTFLGYETTTAPGTVVAIVRDGMELGELQGQGAAEVVLDQTPFYADGGGQIGDRGALRAVGDEVRAVIRDDRPVTPSFMSMQDAIDAGADAFFDEKYGETVRTVRVDGYSHELCGGTHCRATGQIGGFVITGERSIGSGMRRIEASTGAGADAYLRARSEA